MVSNGTRECETAKMISQILYEPYLEYVISNIIDLHGRHVAVTQLRTEHALEAWRCRDQNNFVSVENFAFDSAYEYKFNKQ